MSIASVRGCAAHGFNNMTNDFTGGGIIVMQEVMVRAANHMCPLDAVSRLLHRVCCSVVIGVLKSDELREHLSFLGTFRPSKRFGTDELLINWRDEAPLF